ncbi:MAG: glutaminase [Muribaculaceae bacterium]|nr:glutaminase [Muribaculaceae bacterium]MDE7369068.1 glutaminase [Muribaculaceae bacterium]
MDYKAVIQQIYNEVKPMWGKGKVANYIPALEMTDPRQFGIAVQTLDGDMFTVGDAETKFSIQSISKVFTFAMVLRHLGDKIWTSVGREPSGNPFNSLVQLEHEQGIPRNPFINAGALVVTDRLIDLYPRPKEAILDFIRSLTGNDDIYYDHTIARSEREHADRNMALAYFMKSFGNIHNDVETIIDVYCSQCAISMSCVDLAHAFRFLANEGVNPLNNEAILTQSQAKRLGAVMLTCGFYDESGDFAFRVGMPGKSGVGGGVVAYIPRNLVIATWSPELDAHGNSLMGIETLERFTTDIQNSIF